jgi:glycosyltransferase involved in cell wall biosynthesis
MAQIVFFDHKFRQQNRSSQTGPYTNAAKNTLSRVALIGNFPPRRCGIATFTSDSRDALALARPDVTVDVYAMDDGIDNGPLPADLNYIKQDDAAAYMNAADIINQSGAGIAWLQHEFGIFGGHDGDMIIDLIKAINPPLVITLHTVLENPSHNQRRVMNALIQKASLLIVMAEKARGILRQCYDVDGSKITVIAHGIPDLPYIVPELAKPIFGFEGREVILTFGLLSPEKGIDDMIEAMPRIIAHCPNALYVILGATHPHIIAEKGEELRARLHQRTLELGIQDHVLFIDAFVDLKKLTEYLQAADVYVTPYHNPGQITSGTLSYAVGLGKPVVSTRYVHAQELLGDGTGVLVPFRDPAGLANAIIKLLDNDDYRAELSQRAYGVGRTMTWHRYAKTALKAFELIISQKSPKNRVVNIHTPVIGTAAIERLSDDTGMFQHSRFGVADRNHGYCIDDNARALALMSISHDIEPLMRSKLTNSYAAFVQHAWNPNLGVFRNFMHYDRHWLEDAGSSDSNGRTLWALSLAACQHDDPMIREWANELYRESAPRIATFHSPRALAFSVLAAVQMQKYGLGLDTNLVAIGAGADDLLAKLRVNRRPGWIWFEAGLAYDNCRLPEALLHAGELLGNPEMIEEALAAMEWILQLQISPQGWFRPVGSESFDSPSYSPPKIFDQQPVEALAAIEGCLAAMAHRPQNKWLDYAEVAYAWFMGVNDQQSALADDVSGECKDGLTCAGTNANRGAESVLAWQLASRQIVNVRRVALTQDEISAKA